MIDISEHGPITEVNVLSYFQELSIINKIIKSIAFMAYAVKSVVRDISNKLMYEIIVQNKMRYKKSISNMNTYVLNHILNYVLSWVEIVIY